MTTYWFVYKDIRLLDEVSTYVIPDFMTYSDCKCRYTYEQEEWTSPKYPTLRDMIRAFHSLVMLTGKEPIENFYKDIPESINGREFTQYISNSRELYQRYADGKAKRQLAREAAVTT